jgi:magnesium chelatase family protein
VFTHLSKPKEEDLRFFCQNVKEAAIVAGLDVYGVENVQEVIDFLEGKGNLEPTTIDTRAEFYKDLDFPEFDFSDAKARVYKRCMEIAAGGHNIILIGLRAPKTMLAKRLQYFATHDFTRSARND